MYSETVSYGLRDIWYIGGRGRRAIYIVWGCGVSPSLSLLFALLQRTRPWIPRSIHCRKGPRAMANDSLSAGLPPADRNHVSTAFQAVRKRLEAFRFSTVGLVSLLRLNHHVRRAGIAKLLTSSERRWTLPLPLPLSSPVSSQWRSRTKGLPGDAKCPKQAAVTMAASCR